MKPPSKRKMAGTTVESDSVNKKQKESSVVEEDKNTAPVDKDTIDDPQNPTAGTSSVKQISRGATGEGGKLQTGDKMNPRYDIPEMLCMARVIISSRGTTINDEFMQETQHPDILWMISADSNPDHPRDRIKIGEKIRKSRIKILEVYQAHHPDEDIPELRLHAQKMAKKAEKKEKETPTAAVPDTTYDELTRENLEMHIRCEKMEESIAKKNLFIYDQANKLADKEIQICELEVEKYGANVDVNVTQPRVIIKEKDIIKMPTDIFYNNNNVDEDPSRFFPLAQKTNKKSSHSVPLTKKKKIKITQKSKKVSTPENQPVTKKKSHEPVETVSKGDVSTNTDSDSSPQPGTSGISGDNHSDDELAKDLALSISDDDDETEEQFDKINDTVKELLYAGEMEISATTDDGQTENSFDDQNNNSQDSVSLLDIKDSDEDIAPPLNNNEVFKGDQEYHLSSAEERQSSMSKKIVDNNEKPGPSKTLKKKDDSAKASKGKKLQLIDMFKGEKLKPKKGKSSVPHKTEKRISTKTKLDDDKKKEVRTVKKEKLVRKALSNYRNSRRNFMYLKHFSKKEGKREKVRKVETLAEKDTTEQKKTDNFEKVMKFKIPKKTVTSLSVADVVELSKNSSYEQTLDEVSALSADPAIENTASSSIEEHSSVETKSSPLSTQSANEDQKSEDNNPSTFDEVPDPNSLAVSDATDLAVELSKNSSNEQSLDDVPALSAESSLPRCRLTSHENFCRAFLNDLIDDIIEDDENVCRYCQSDPCECAEMSEEPRPGSVPLGDPLGPNDCFYCRQFPCVCACWWCIPPGSSLIYRGRPGN